MGNKLKGAIFGPCLGIGGGDGFFSSLVATTWESIHWTGIFTSSGATRDQYTWARRQTAGGVRFHQTLQDVKRLKTKKTSLCKYHETTLQAARAAARGADFVISWHCEDTPEISRHEDFAEIAFIEVIQNEDGYAQARAAASAEYAFQQVAVSEAAGKHTYGEDWEPNVMPNGIETERILPRLGRQAARQLWGIGTDDEEIVIIFAGRLSPEKNPEAILDALELLPDNYTALFVGDGPLREPLENRACRGFPGRVRFLPTAHHIGDAYAVSDVFVLASDFEGDSLAWKEALCAGLPCVCTAVGSVAETIEAAGLQLAVIVNGRPAGLELSHVIKSAIGEKDKLHTLTSRNINRNYALEHFTIASAGAAWTGFLTNVVAEWGLYRINVNRERRMHAVQATPITRIGEQRVQNGPHKHTEVFEDDLTRFEPLGEVPKDEGPGDFPAGDYREVSKDKWLGDFDPKTFLSDVALKMEIPEEIIAAGDGTHGDETNGIQLPAPEEKLAFGSLAREVDPITYVPIDEVQPAESLEVGEGSGEAKG